MQKNRSIPDVQIKRKTWIENIAGAKPEHQIYLDESGINTNLTRHYAHAVHGKRAIDAAPINTPAGTTVLSSIRLNGSLVYTTYQGGTTAQRFREYMKEQLIPSLEKDDVVIMDNMRSHHAKIVTELLNKAGISYVLHPAAMAAISSYDTGGWFCTASTNKIVSPIYAALANARRTHRMTQAD